MNKYLERTNASKPTFGDYVTLEMKRYGVPNEHFIHEVLSSPFTSNSWRNVPIDARDPEEHLHDTGETVIAVRTQGINSRDAQIFAVRLADVLPMKGTNWSWRESPLRSRIAELEEENDRLQSAWFVEETICPDGSLKPKVSALLSRIAELEAAQRWIPVSEPPKECEMRVFKDGNAWCFVLPDFQDLQVSPSVWMQKGVLDKIYKELRSVRDE